MEDKGIKFYGKWLNILKFINGIALVTKDWEEDVVLINDLIEVTSKVR